MTPMWHFIFPYPLGASGSGLLVQDIAYGLANRGYRTHLITVEMRPYYPSHPLCSWDGLIFDVDFPLKQIPVYTQIAAPSIPFCKLGIPEYRRYREVLIRHWRNVLKPAPEDIVIVSHLWTHAAFLREMGIRVDGIMVHGTDLIAYEMTTDHHDEIRLAARWSKTLIANSSFTQQCIIQLGLARQDKIVKIWPIVDTDIFSYIPIQHNNTRRCIIHIPGKFVPFKGTDRLLRAIPYYERECRGIYTAIYGNGSLSEELEKLARQTPFRNLEWHQGWRSRYETAELLRKADVLVVPSRNEPFGMIAAESLACGTPVIGDHSGGLRDIVRSQDGELVDSENPCELAQAILGSLKGGRDFASARTRSRRAMARFGREAVVEKWIMWYKGIRCSPKERLHET